jgi:hypothetical protein
VGLLLTSLFVAGHRQYADPSSLALLMVPYAVAAVAALIGNRSRVQCRLATGFAVIVGGIGVWIALLGPLDAQFAGLVLLAAVAVQLVFAAVGLVIVGVLRFIFRSRASGS